MSLRLIFNQEAQSDKPIKTAKQLGSGKTSPSGANRGLFALSRVDVLTAYTEEALDDLPLAMAAWLVSTPIRRSFEKLYNVKLSVPDAYKLYDSGAAADYLQFKDRGYLLVMVYRGLMVPCITFERLGSGRGVHFFFKKDLDAYLRRNPIEYRSGPPPLF